MGVEIEINFITCKKCNINKPHTKEFFSYYDNGSGRKLRKTCRECSYNKERQKQYSNLYYQKNKNNILAKRKQYNIDNQGKRKENNAKYYHQNKERLNKDHKLYMKKRRKEILFKLVERIRGRIYHAIIDKYPLTNKMVVSYTNDLLGCSKKEIRNYLENKFQEGMSWDNYGRYGWHIDHIKPCSSFDLSELEEQKKCFHYTNLQPLWARDNLEKGKKITHEVFLK